MRVHPARGQDVQGVLVLVVVVKPGLDRSAVGAVELISYVNGALS
ncbi:hypothetical protein [Streptomyces sp. PT12]|nr:hypothetical protein [Streptomyces sp. PT12]